ncbi:MAG: hypothetical protein HPY50_15740 [Firmicutes bacterium]|nr:hypothetical protein [Bacillota bacterium]
MNRFFRYCPLLLAGMAVVLTAAIIVSNPGYIENFSQTSASMYVRNLLQGKSSTGVFSGRANDLDFSLAEPGDILLAGDQDGCYGHFTHAGIYLGQGMVLEGYVDCGVSRQRQEHYRYYDWACIVRVKIPREQRQAALEYALQQEYKTFYPIAFKDGERYWNCTKVIWAAYLRQGVDLDSMQDIWVTPDSIYRSRMIDVLTSSGEMPI